MEKTAYRLIGVMSGTSLDGIDLVLCEFEFKENIDFKILVSKTFPYTKKWHNKLIRAVNLDAAELNILDHDYTLYLAGVINGFIREYDIDLLDAVCSHGHTVKHRPDRGVTFQIGNLPQLSKLIEVPVVCDFRVQDVELGGQGAPLVPIGDRLLFKDYKYCINLGGFANISTEEFSTRIAYDICPLNTVLNYFMQKLNKEFDEDGLVARSGELDEKLLKELNDLRYYSKAAPKSLGIEWVNHKIIPLIEKYKLEIPVIIRTFTVHAAMQIVNCLENNHNSEVLLTGGGAYNKFLIEELRKRSSCNFILPKNDLIDFKEALIFALLGALKLREEVNVLSSVTGAKMDHSSGRIYYP